MCAETKSRSSVLIWVKMILLYFCGFKDWEIFLNLLYFKWSFAWRASERPGSHMLLNGVI